MNSKTKTELLAKLKALKSYPAPEEMGAILAALLEVLPDELFADADKKAETADAGKKEGAQAFTPPAAPVQP